MLKPLIVIGCGGSGVETVSYLRKSVINALSNAGWDGPMPQAWQFIGVDVDIQRPYETEPIPESDYVCLGGGISYPVIQTIMETKHPGGSAGCSDMLGWKPSATVVRPPIPQSAGGFRSVGRMAGLAALMPQLSHRLLKAYEAIKSGTEEFRQLTELLTGHERELTPSDREPLVVVVGSMAGGTGSAIMLDINEMVRRVNTSYSCMFNVVYSADVFESIRGSNTKLNANSLAFMSELVAFSWNGQGTSDLIEHGTKKEYIQPPLTFMVEKTNLHGLSMSYSQKESFEQIASWLTGVAISPDEQLQLLMALEREFAHSNITSGGYGFEKLSVNLPLGAIRSLGHAKLSVGRDRFSEYATKLLQRETVKFLLNGDRAAIGSQFDNQSTVTNVVNVRKNAEDILQTFLVAANLSVSSELEAHFIDSVFNAFHTKSLSELVELELERELEAAIENGIDQKTSFKNTVQLVRVNSLQNYSDLISTEIRELKHRVLEGIAREVNNNFATLSIPVVNEVLRVTQQLIDQTSSQIRMKAANQLRKSELEHDHALEVLDRIQTLRFSLGRFWKMFRPSFIKNLIGRTDKSYLDIAANSIILGIQSQFLDYLSVSLEELANNDLAKVVRQLDDSVAILHSRFAEMVDWPKIDQEVPRWLRPRPFEFCLEGYESWPNSLRSLITESQTPREDADKYIMQIARTSILMGGYESHDGELRRPLFEGFVKDFQVCDIKSIENRVEDWLRRKGSGFGQFVYEGLRSYLLPHLEFNSKNNNVDHEHRLQRYSEVLDAVLYASQPLIQIDENLSNKIYGHRAIVSYPYFELPFLPGAADEILTKAMLKRFPELQMRSFNRYKGGPGNVSSFGFTSLLNYPLNPSVFRRFTESQEALIESCIDSTVHFNSVHRFRRTRRLIEYIPLPTELRHAAIRGFAVGRILGYVTIDTNEAIRISGMDGEYIFPRRLMTSSEPRNLLPALLESMPLCFADVPKKGQEAFGAYRELISLGIGSNGPRSFESDNDCLKYIATGIRLRIPVDTKRAELMTAETADERQQIMSNYLNGNLRMYDEVLASLEVAPNISWSSLRSNSFSAADKLTIELIDDLLSGYHMVLNSVNGSQHNRSIL